jgi:hypothetical protein
MSPLIFNCFGCEPVSPGFILPFCRYRPVELDASLPAWSRLPTELEKGDYIAKNILVVGVNISLRVSGGKRMVPIRPFSKELRGNCCAKKLML